MPKCCQYESKSGKIMQNCGFSGFSVQGPSERGISDQFPLIIQWVAEN